MNKTISIFLLFMGLCLFYACSDGFDDYSSNTGDQLAFSTDTVVFDTIISTVNTPFQVFKIYNPNSKPLLIESVYLENGEQSGFKINVDGRAGASFKDVEIRANDSLFVFVDAKPAETGRNEPVLYSDHIVFVTNGVQQKVVLRASAQDAFIWKGRTITSNTALSNEKPYVIYDSLVVDEGVTLQIKEGTTFYMHNAADIIVRGTLKIKGTLEKPVVIRGDRFDYLVDIPYDRVPGQWGGIRLEANSFNNEIDYAQIRNGMYGLDIKPSALLHSKIILTNTVLTNFKGILIRAVNCMMDAENCEFSNSKGALLDLTGGMYFFVHCTMANYYFSSTEAGWGNSDNETIHLRSTYIVNEQTGEKIDYPIYQANFGNNIIWGPKKTSDISIENKNVEKDGFWNVHYFVNCVIPNKDAKNDDPNSQDTIPTVVDCLIAVDPKFANVDKDGTLFYDFRLDSISPARDTASVAIARDFPYDMKGISRFRDDGPDMGAYEYVKP
ncbi:hypothetical protein AGMMS50262_17710 [Bacteroidia bacterium]|nr:hypothetical protein AGMMS50262_17710 [Bacteroidia bacterium]